MEESDNYSKEELSDMFEIVNSQHLHLKGKKKSVSKRQFTSVWKRDNKSLSAYELMIALYKSEEINDKQNEFMKQFMDNNGMSGDEVKTKRPVSYAKHIKRLRYKDEQIEELQDDLDNVLEDNNLMSKEDHIKAMKNLKEQHKFELLEKDDKITKQQLQINMFDSRMKAKDKTHAEIIKNYEKQLDAFSKES
jgi:hypothetical protein|tara:strand:- start:292 stop:867 length:576 start_codon:yes stop_codon:yes gene_type:complete